MVVSEWYCSLDLAEHDLIPSVVELHGVVVTHGVVAAEVDALLHKE